MKRQKEKGCPLLRDHVFKQVFSNRKNTASLRALLKAVLHLDEEDLDTLEIENTFVERSWSEDKLVIFDIKAGSASGKSYEIDLQAENNRLFPNRMVYYLCRLTVEQLRRGHNYDRLRPVYCVAICNFRILPDDSRYIHRFALRDESNGEIFTNLQNMVIIELPKMPNEDDGSGAWPVLECFRCKTIEEAEMHAKAYPGIREIVEELKSFSLTKEVRAAYEMYQKTRRDREMWKYEYREQERERWEAAVSAAVSEKEAVNAENEALRRELERLRGEGGKSV
jgi:predicted transposase/invertase (TIGR01784 family)